jgi:DNA-binding NarL/FixJ family response regulator/tRNA A-37 threonylcarbamoyl transferase component Bud32
MDVSSPISILIVEDHPLMRNALKMLLDDTPGLVVTGEAADGYEAIEQAEKLQPAVVLMDIGLPRLDGVEATKIIRQKCPESRFLVLTSHQDDSALFAALGAGANGYCLKAASKDQIVTAIKAVNEGGTWLDPAIAGRVLQMATKMTNSSNASTNSGSSSNEPELGELSKDEKELLSAIMQGMSAAEIASKYSVGEKQIEEQIQTLLGKLSDTDQAHKALEAMKNSFAEKTSDFDGDPFVGATIDGRYEILEPLGKGGVGTVYKARHKFIKKLVAIKMINPEQRTDIETLQRFRIEAEAASALKHHNLVNVFDFGVTPQGQAFMVMDLFEGPNLMEIIVKEGRIALNEAINIFVQICNGMEAAHLDGVIHRDLKPSNILLATEGGQSEIVKILDFGIAKLMRLDNAKPNDITQAGEVFGSPLYMSPEQCRGLTVDVRSDIYSLGCLMYECLTGRPPFMFEDVHDTFYHQVHHRAPAFAEIDATLKIPQPIERIIFKAIEKDPDKRYQSMEALKGALIYSARLIRAS